MSSLLAIIIAIIITLVFIITGLAMIFASVFQLIVYLLLKQSPYVPTKKEIISQIFNIAPVLNNKKFLDVGCGDGRIVIGAAQRGALAVGYEINPWLVWLSRFKIKKAGLKNKAKINHSSFWKANLADYDVIYCYTLPLVMKNFEAKLNREAKRGTVVISNSFPLPIKKPIKQIGKIYLYQL